MKIRLNELRPNPYRDFHVDPIDSRQVQALRASIEQDGFWGGIVCRRMKGEIQIGAGHHRVEAALQAGIKEADICVASLDDEAMIRVYARENATQRGHIDLGFRVCRLRH
jgi:ParB-like chromosome segregation protein Spo0J